ncbi:MAG: oxygen-independent coproporphyrinogen III oxidase [Acidobacteriota bacterium]
MSLGTPVPAELLSKYGKQGPRYTSYPTAPHFDEAVEYDALAQAWQESSDDLSLYVHLPFCAVRCLFCGCHVKITRRTERGMDYVDRVLAELDLAGRHVDLSRPLRQLHFGGGTPNFLPPEGLRRLFEGLIARAGLAPDAEVAIECDPRALSHEQVDTLLDLGFNRFSFGVQDLEPEVMAAVNRPTSQHDLEEMVDALRKGGVRSLNFDLIYGLPKQTQESWERTLATVLDLGPDRLAVYGYAHVPWKARHQGAIDAADLPDDALRSELAATARRRLVAGGHVEIGMDHYALPDDELARARRDGSLHRNFMGYTTQRGLDLVAIGTSAISKVGRSYSQDLKDLAAWETAVSGGRMPWERGLVLSEDDLLRGEIITELSCNGRLDHAEFADRFGCSPPERYPAEYERLQEMATDGLLTVDDDAIELTDVGFYLVRNACMVFDTYLATEAEAVPRYSRTT